MLQLRHWQRASCCGDILRVVTEEVTGGNCHRAARRARDHPYLARQLSDGGSGQPTGVLIHVVLVVRRGDQELRTRWLC
jgi:hypothetical protein